MNPVDVLPAKMRLEPSSEVKAEASTRTMQSKIKFKQQIKIDRLKTMAITQIEADHNQAIADSAPPEEAEVLTMDSDDELQRAVVYSLDHFSKHAIEMDATERGNDTSISTAPEAATKHCMGCKGTKAAAEFPPWLATCNKCRTRKRQRRNKNSEPKGIRAGRKLCNSKKWCPIKSVTGSNKTCNDCIEVARSLTVARRQRQYAVPTYSATNTSEPDFLYM